MSGFGTFGTAAPATGGLFGANKSATGFGAFGTAPPNQTAGLAFGTATTPGTGLFNTSQPNTGFQFGTSTSATTTTTGLNFGTPAPLGALTNTVAPGFGTNPSFNFGAPKTTSSLTLGFGTATPSTGLGLGPTSTTSTLPGTGFNLGGITQPTAGLSFAAKPLGTATTTAPTTALNLGLTPSTNFQLGGTSSLFGVKTDITSLSTSTATTTIGLGGVDSSQSKPGLAGPCVTEPKQAKDNIVPDPILQALSDFQNFTRQQKSISVEISHCSSKPLKKVQEVTEALEAQLGTLNNGLTKNAIAVDRLKAETAQGLHQAEMAQRTHELPPGLGYDNSASSEYFEDLAAKLEGDAIRLRVQMETAEKHLHSLTQSSTISPQELTLAMKHLHETLVVLAARVQMLHTTVASHKEQYRSLRRIHLKDDSAVFQREEVKKPTTTHTLRSLTGPTPFSGSHGGGSLNQDALAALTSSTVSAFGATSPDSGWLGAAHTSVLAGTTSVLTAQPVENTAFPLSKPPAGNKRNKR